MHSGRISDGCKHQIRFCFSHASVSTGGTIGLACMHDVAEVRFRLQVSRACVRHSRDVVPHRIGNGPAISLVSKHHSSSHTHKHTHFNASARFDTPYWITVHSTECEDAGEQTIVADPGVRVGYAQSRHYATIHRGKEALDSSWWSEGYHAHSVQLLGQVSAYQILGPIASGIVYADSQ